MTRTASPLPPVKRKNKKYPATALILRTCNADMTAHGGFIWPESGPVESPDWNPEPHCGHGLHGLLWGEGDACLLSADADARWLVVEVEASACVDLGGKVKFPRGSVVFCGTRDAAVQYIQANGGSDKAVAYGAATAGAYGAATAGDYGVATAGYGGAATAGDYGAATAGDYGVATAGYYGAATAGDGGTATAGDYGIIQIQRWNRNRYRRIVTGYVGEGGIEPGKAYLLDENGAFVLAAEGARA